MSEIIKSESIYTEDGRRGKRIVQDYGDSVLTEVYVEPEVTKVLSTRILEKKRPIIFERTIETVNEAGEIIEKRTESLDPPAMEVREHIGLASSPVISVQSVSADSSNDCHVTKEDLQLFGEQMADKTFEGLMAVAKHLQSAQNSLTSVIPAPPTASVSPYQIAVAEKVNGNSSIIPNGNAILWTVVAAVGGYWAYLIWF